MEVGKWCKLSLEPFNNSALFEINIKEQIKPNQRNKRAYLWIIQIVSSKSKDRNKLSKSIVHFHLGVSRIETYRCWALTLQAEPAASSRWILIKWLTRRNTVLNPGNAAWKNANTFPSTGYQALGWTLSFWRLIQRQAVVSTQQMAMSSFFQNPGATPCTLEHLLEPLLLVI